MRHLRCFALGLLLVSTLLRAESLRVDVDVKAHGAVIDRHIFGQFAEHLGRGVYEGIWVGRDSPIANTRGIRNDVVAALKALHVPVVRWPGGCFAEEYHWRNGVGPPESRPATLNPNWGNVVESNAFGTQEFMDFAEQIGADPYLSVNVGSGTPAEAADWLEYLTAQSTTLAAQRARDGHPAPFAVPFLGLGNESWGCGGAMTADEYVGQMKRYARFARNFNAAQPMQRIAVGADGSDTSYTEAVMNAWQHKVWSWNIDHVSVHAYTLGTWPPSFRATGFGEDEYAALLADALRMEDIVRTQAAVMDRYDPEKKIGLAVDEWGAWLAPTPGSNPDFLEQQNSQRDALIAALNLNIFARHADRVRMANIAQMVNVLQAMILTDQAHVLLTPTYHVFRLYVPFQQATQLPVRVTADNYVQGDRRLPRLDVLAARGRDGRIWLSLVNLDARRTTTVTLNVPGASRAAGDTLNGPAIDSINTFARPDVVVTRAVRVTGRPGALSLELPAHSVSVIALE